MHTTLRWLRPLLAAALVGLALPAPAADERTDYSPAERALFMSPQLRNIKPPDTLRYSFSKSGSLEPGFEDSVSIQLTASADGTCCTASGEFLTGPRRMVLPEVAAAEGNPAILFFLEREIREMQRLTKGSQNHFRKQIRMAVFQGAKMRDVALRYRGRTVQGQEVVIEPYLDDPNRPRFEKFARKQYSFLLSDAVPGGLYAIRTQVNTDDASAPPLLAEELAIEGAEPSSTSSKP